MVGAQAVKGCTEITEKQSLGLVRNLLRIALYNISYIRGLFPEKYYQEKYVPALEMKIKKLVPLDDESRRLIDWMEKGVYDALEKKYLKTMIFAICDEDGLSLLEEYTFSFTYDAPNGGCKMQLKAGSKPGQDISTQGDVTMLQMKSAACKMVRTLAQLMRTLDSVPDKRTLVVKLFYYDVTPEDYEPPFFRTCDPEEQLTWSDTPLKMKVGDVNTRHLTLALKVRSILDPCDNEEEQQGSMSHGTEDSTSSQSLSEDVAPTPRTSEKSKPSKDKNSLPDSAAESDAETQDAHQDYNVVKEIKEWLRSLSTDSVDSMDVLARFPETSMVLIEEVLEGLVKDNVLIKIKPDVFRIVQETPLSGNPRKGQKSGASPTAVSEAASTGDVSVKHQSDTEEPEQQSVPSNTADETPREDFKKQALTLYDRVLYFVLQVEHITLAALQAKVGQGMTKEDVKDILERLVKDGFVEAAPSNKRKGRKVNHSEATRAKLLELKEMMDEEKASAADSRSNARPGKLGTGASASVVNKNSADGCMQSMGSDITRSKVAATAPDAGPISGKPPVPGYRNDSQRDDQTLGRRAPPDASCNEGPKPDAGEEPFESQEAFQGSQRIRKASMVIDPIHQAKRTRPEQ